MEESEEIEVCIISTINGRILIGEITTMFSSGIELKNVFLIDNSNPEGMMPLHQDSVMADTKIYIRNQAIETESKVSEDLRNIYISNCLKELIIKMQLKEDNNETFFGFNSIDPLPFKGSSSELDNIKPIDLINQSLQWRNKYKNN